MAHYAPSVTETPTPDRKASAIDTGFAWVLYLFQVGASVIFAVFALMGVMATDSCGTGDTDPWFCDGNSLGALIIGFWIVDALLLVLVPILILRARARGRLQWLRALGGGVALAGAAVGFVGALSLGW